MRPIEDPAQFDEGAAQVKRLLERDRKELMGLEEIGSNLKTEFDEDIDLDVRDQPKSQLSPPDPQRAFQSKQATTSGPMKAAGDFCKRTVV